MNINLSDKVIDRGMGLMTPEQADAALVGMSQEAIVKYRMRELLTDPAERRRLLAQIKITA